MRVILMRHAKSDWSRDGLADFDRPLAARGHRDAPRIAADMVRNGLMPATMLVSTAKRTRETLGHLLEVFPHNMQISLDTGLYGGDARTYIDTLAKHAGGDGDLMLLGHNPSVQEATLLLLSAPEGEDAVHLRTKFPTAAYAVIDFEGGAIAAGQGRLRSFVVPRSLDG